MPRPEDAVRISVVVPYYNEESLAEESCRRIAGVMERMGEPYELVLVNDGSRDATKKILAAYCRENPRATLLSFGRNFGHQAAITAGVEHARGEAIVTIDADLQDPPEVIPELVAKWREGFAVVYAKRTERLGETAFKKSTATLFYRFLNRMTSVELPVDIGDFRLIDRKVRSYLVAMPEKHRYVRGLVAWLGLSQAEVPYVRRERHSGTTKYPLRKMLLFATDAITSFSIKPLRLASYVGAFTAIAGFLYLFVVLYLRIFTDRTVSGWASLVSINLVFNGVVLLILGIIGEYVGRIYDEVKGRPLYVLDEIVTGRADGKPGEPGKAIDGTRSGGTPEERGRAGDVGLPGS